MGGGLADPGWVPMMGGQRQQTVPQARRYAPMGHHSPPVNRPGRTPEQLTPPPPQPARDQHYEPPAWVGSLRHSGGPRPWEMAEAQQLMGGGRAGYRGPPQTAVGIFCDEVYCIVNKIVPKAATDRVINFHSHCTKIGYVRVFLRVEMLSLQGFMMILW